MSQKPRLFNVIGPVCAASIFAFGILSHIQAVKGITKIRASLSAATQQIDSSALSGLLEKVNNSASWGMLLCSVGAALMVVMLVSRNKSTQSTAVKNAE